MKNDFPRLNVPESVRRKMVEVAREFRKRSTDSERSLWQALRGKKLDGLKFRLESQRDNFSSPTLGEGQGRGK